MDMVTTIEDLAKTVGTDIETFGDTEYHAFLTATMPLYNDVRALAVTTGNADLQTFLNDQAKVENEELKVRTQRPSDQNY